jgi:hypothetical protein
MTELIRGGKGTISLHGCSAEKHHYYKKKLQDEHKLFPYTTLFRSALHTKRRERPLLAKDGTKTEK